MTKPRVAATGVTMVLVAVLAILKPDAPMRLAWRDWEVVSMTGFASEPIPGASFRFFGDEIRLNDGANSMNFRVDWSRGGFRVEAALISTQLGLPDGTSTFAEMFEVGRFIDVIGGWQEVILSRGGMVAVARD